jgi:hypothetical protein
MVAPRDADRFAAAGLTPNFVDLSFHVYWNGGGRATRAKGKSEDGPYGFEKMTGVNAVK